jgi:hypothetical protein
MSWIDRFGGKKKRHARGSPTDDRTDSDAFTRQIHHGRNPKGADPDPLEWDSLPDDQPPIEYDQRDAPTLQSKPPPPAPRPPRPAPFQPPVSSYPDDDKTVLATGSSAARGKVVAVLLGVEGPLDGHVIRVFEGDNLIGREGQPDPIPNTADTKTISRKHAMLGAEAGYFALEPVDAKNATFVNEKVIDARELIQHGDRVRLGSAKPSTFVLLVVP